MCGGVGVRASGEQGGGGVRRKGEGRERRSYGGGGEEIKRGWNWRGREWGGLERGEGM